MKEIWVNWFLQNNPGSSREEAEEAFLRNLEEEKRIEREEMKYRASRSEKGVRWAGD